MHLNVRKRHLPWNTSGISRQSDGGVHLKSPAKHCGLPDLRSYYEQHENNVRTMNIDISTFLQLGCEDVSGHSRIHSNTGVSGVGPI